MGCPQCHTGYQIQPLETYWKSLAPGSELKAELAQPEAEAARWVPAAGLLTIGVLMVNAGEKGWGVLLILAGLMAGLWAWRAYQAVEEAREAWLTAMYCQRCPLVFQPNEGIVEAA